MNVRPSHVSATETVPSTCWECSALCGSLLTVEDGKVSKIAPNPKHPGSRGAFCVMEFTEILGQSQPRLSRHLKLLCECGLLDRVRKAPRFGSLSRPVPTAIWRGS